MKIIVINALSALRGGGQTYLINFFKHLPEGDFKILVIANTINVSIFSKHLSNKVEVHEAIWASKNIIHRVLWELFCLPKFLKKKKADVFYAPGGILLSKPPKNVISVTALRNMLPFDKEARKKFPIFSYLRFKFFLLRYVFLRTYKIADKIIFISEHSRSLVKGNIRDINQKSVVIPHGLNYQFINSKQVYKLPSLLLENKFYLYVSILDYYKAQKEVIKAWHVLSNQGFEYPLVIAGPKYNKYGDEVLSMINNLKLQDKVIYLGKVDYEKLPGLYKSSRVLLFASSCECCPNILLEKLSAGKPVLCSNIEPMPEFGEDAVEYFNPNNTDSLVSQINVIEKNESQMKLMGEKARKQSLKFDWNNTIKKTIKFLLNTQKEKEL